MAIDNSNRFFYLRSEMKFGFWNGDTAPDAFYGPVNFTKLEISTPAQNSIQLLSNMESTHGNLLDSQFTTTEPAKLACEFTSMPGNLLALMLGATTADISQTTAAVADEAITPVVGVWAKLANSFLSADSIATPIVFETATSVTIANSNYEIDLVNGMYRAITSLGATATIVSYHTATRSGEIYNAGLSQDQYVQMVGTATEKVTNKRCAIQIHKASLMPASKFDPVASTHLMGALEGNLILPTGFTSPWFFEYTDMSA